MKSLLLFLTFVLLIAPSLAANEQAKQSLSPNMQFSDIEEYLSGRKQGIENYYSDRLVELRLRAQADIRVLEVAEQPKPDCVGLDEWSEFAETILQINRFENESYGLFESVKKTPSERLALALSRIANRKNDILADSEWRALRLERQRNYALTDGFEKFRKQVKASQLKTKQEATQGVIAGIIFTKDDPISIIDGIAVRASEKIHGVEIVKIYKDRVEFKRNGKTWTQQIRETQDDNWK